jgi:DNA-binding NarL/FixJ family response regulator
VNSIRVLIADDHPVFRFGLRALLTAEPTTQLVGEAANGNDAIELADSIQPDIILMDLSMPGLGGLDAIRVICHRHPEIGIIVLTMQVDADALVDAMRAGSRGYVVKGATTAEIVQAIHTVHGGGVVFGQQVAQVALSRFDRDTRPIDQPFPELTQREREILVLVAAGKTNAAIADALFLSPKTVRNHVSIIFHKLDVGDRGAAIVKARSAGLVPD